MKTFNEVRKEFKATGSIDELVVNCLRVLEANQESKVALEKAITNSRGYEFKCKEFTTEDGETYVCEIRDLIWVMEFVSGGKITDEEARKACYRCLYKGKFYGLPLSYETYVMTFEEGKKYGGVR